MTMTVLSGVDNRFADRLHPGRAALVLIDCQEGLIEQDADRPAALRNNLFGLARVARAYRLPVLISVTRASGSGSLLHGLTELFDPAAIVERRSGAFIDDAAAQARLRALGRRDLILAGVVPGMGIAGPALAARFDGHHVHVVEDASAGGDDTISRIAVARMTAVGIRLATWVAVMAELASTGGAMSPLNAAQLRDNLARYAGGCGSADDDRLLLHDDEATLVP